MNSSVINVGNVRCLFKGKFYNCLLLDVAMTNNIYPALMLLSVLCDSGLPALFANVLSGYLLRNYMYEYQKRGLCYPVRLKSAML